MYEWPEETQDGCKLVEMFKQCNFLSLFKKVTLFEHLNLIVSSESEMNDSWWQQRIGLFRSDCWHSSVLSQALFRKDSIWAVNNPQVIAEAFISSFTPIQLRPILLALLHSHFINFNHGWTRNETDDGGDSKRNRRQRVASKSLPNIAYSLFVPSVRRYSRNRFDCKYHNNASAYSLQTVYCRYIFLHDENETQPTRTTEADCPDERENFRWQHELNSQSAQ